MNERKEELVNIKRREARDSMRVMNPTCICLLSVFYFCLLLSIEMGLSWAL